MYLMFLGQGF